MSEASLKEGEPHPGAQVALKFMDSLTFEDWQMAKESMASSALAGNETADVCLSTIHRLENKETVSDRYLMGLAWVLYMLKHKK